ncbi:hypothetical protein ANN_20986 [Periplaneta americana]|uniref:HAT C-terminal dimerisation domain-containing protein n=1 Tax=Periplaneta americana TaxID=6978 RepID=A0ABQ8SFD9_PERAM|nr:hypothetical protein ANN_20986 [Periplaneta americana]
MLYFRVMAFTTLKFTGTIPHVLEDTPLINRQHIHFLHDGAPAHFSRTARRYLDRRFPDRWIGRGGPIGWPPRSPDLNPLNFYLWGHLKSLVYSSPVPDLESLRNRIVACSEDIRNTPGVWDRVHRSMRHRYESINAKLKQTLHEERICRHDKHVPPVAKHDTRRNLIIPRVQQEIVCSMLPYVIATSYRPLTAAEVAPYYSFSLTLATAKVISASPVCRNFVPQMFFYMPVNLLTSGLSANDDSGYNCSANDRFLWPSKVNLNICSSEKIDTFASAHISQHTGHWPREPLKLAIGISLLQSLADFDRTIPSLTSVPGNVEDKVNEKTANILSKNPSYYQEIQDILEEKLPKTNKFSLEQLTAFVQAPLTSCDVERSFSRYKAMLRDNRRRMTTENMSLLSCEL